MDLFSSPSWDSSYFYNLENVVVITLNMASSFVSCLLEILWDVSWTFSFYSSCLLTCLSYFPLFYLSVMHSGKFSHLSYSELNFLLTYYLIKCLTCPLSFLFQWLYFLFLEVLFGSFSVLYFLFSWCPILLILVSYSFISSSYYLEHRQVHINLVYYFSWNLNYFSNI